MSTPDPVRDQVLDLAGRLAGIRRDEWDMASLCDGWRIRDVCAHLIAGEQGAFTFAAVVAGMVRYRGSFDRWLAVDGRSRGQQDPSTILADLRVVATSRPAPPRSGQLRALTHVLVHGQDMCRPLGIDRDLPEADLVAVAGFVSTSIIFRAKRRISGLRLEASDLEWTFGQGPVVVGRAEALIMTMAGRAAALDELAGEGAESLRQSFGR